MEPLRAGRPAADGAAGPRAESLAGRALPAPVRRVLGYGAAVLVVAAVGWLVMTVLLRLALVTFSLAVALLLAALLAPLAARLRRRGLPDALAALTTVLVLLGVPLAAGLVIYARVSGGLDDLSVAVTQGIDEVRAWLVDGPLQLDPAQVDQLRDTIVRYLQQAVPSPVGGATRVLRGLGAVLLVVFAVFFLLKDGAAIWRWLLSWTPRSQRARVDGAGRQAWAAVTSYTRGTILVATMDAVLIGAGLLLLSVPLWMSLTLLTFFAAFVPLLGATVAGAAAVLVTLVTNDLGDALVVLAVVLGVQQLEGNVLQPLIMGRAVSLHPLVILVAVTCGTLLLGIAGAVIAVPVVAAGYAAAAYLAGRVPTTPAVQP